MTLGQGRRRIGRALGAIVLAVLLVVAGAGPAEAGSAGAGRKKPGAATAQAADQPSSPGGGDVSRGGRGSSPQPGDRQSVDRQPANRQTATRQRANQQPASRPGPSHAPAAKAGNGAAPARPERPARPAMARSNAGRPAPGPVQEPETVVRAEAVTPQEAAPWTAPATTAIRAREARVRSRAATPRIQPAPLPAWVETLVQPVAHPVQAAVTATIAERAPRSVWESLPGAVTHHPSFPGLLAAVLIGFVALACRGDRRDPKLAAAAVDGRDERTSFG